MRKGYLRIICLMLIGLLMLPPMVLAEGAPRIEISAPSGAVGETVEVVFAAKNMPACATMNLIITYDSVSLKPKAVKNRNIAETFLDNINATHQDAPAIKIVAASFAQTGASPIFQGDLELFSIEFEIIGGTLEEQGAAVTIAEYAVSQDDAALSAVKVETAPAYVAVPAAEVSSIALKALPHKTQYLEGNGPLDLAGGMLLVTYDNSLFEELPLSVATVSGFDAEQPGEQELTVSYQGQQTSFLVYVAQKKAEGIALTTLPHQTAFLEGKDPFSAEGGVITLYYNNDTEEEIPLSAAMVSGFDHTVVGLQTLTVTYGEFTTQYQVEIIGKSMELVGVTTLPQKIAYGQGKELFDPAGGKLTVYYNNDTYEEVALEQAEIIGFDNSRVGAQTLTALYEGFAAEFEVEIIPLVLLEVETPQNKALPGEQITATVGIRNYRPLSGLSIAVTYDPTLLKLEEKDISAANIPGLAVLKSMQEDGDQAVAKIVWMGAEDAPMEESFTALTLKFTAIRENPPADTAIHAAFMEGGMVNNSGAFEGYQEEPSFGSVGLARLSSIAMKKLPDLLDYPQNGAPFDPAGGVIELVYENERKVERPLEKATLTGFDNSTPGKKTITATYLGKSTAFEVDIMGAPSFTDVRPEDWFYKMVQYAQHKGLMKGDPEGTFRPEDSMTRAELVTMFYRLEGEPTHSGSNSFGDVDTADWYYDEILWAAENGLVRGKGENIFDPEAFITRQELVTIFLRYAKMKGLDSGRRTEISIFADRAEIADWAIDPIQWSVAEGLIIGKEEGGQMIFAPESSATRAEVATVMMRMIQKFKLR